MNSGRTLRIELTSSEISTLTEVMCGHGCSMEEAVRLLIEVHGNTPAPVRRTPPKTAKYMREYMRDYRQAMREGIPVTEFRRRKYDG